MSKPYKINPAIPCHKPDEFAYLSLQEMGPLGDTLAILNKETVNVFGGISGEYVVARIVRYQRRRKSHVSAIVSQVIQASPHRVTPPCPYFGPCTGCQWQHISYEHQLELKRAAVLTEINRFPELKHVPVANTVPSSQMFGYRNHARFTVRRQGSLGFNNRITRHFVPVDECMIMDPRINKALGKLQGKCEETTNISIRLGTNTGDLLIQPTLQNPLIPLSSGQPHYEEKLWNNILQVSSPSFFQVNTLQAERLVEIVRDRLQLNETHNLIDAYAGVGTFAILLAPYVAKIFAIEESKAAVKDAVINAAGIKNLQFCLGKTETILSTMDKRPDAVILDPPRLGCQPAALKALANLAPTRVVYVSCDPVSLAQNLHVLTRLGFSVDAVEPVDMFPQTHHVECIASLKFHGQAS